MNIIEWLDYGVDKFDAKIRGGTCNSLDGITAPRSVELAVKRSKECIHNDLCDLGAKGGRAITITFSDHYLNIYKVDYLDRDVRKVLSKMKCVIQFHIISEYSEAGRYHYHGVILCKDLKGYGSVRRKMATYGICKLKPIDNSPKWATYVIKSIK